MTYASPFPTFSTPDLNQRAAALWLSLLGTFAITDVLGLMLLEQLAFSHWAAQELARKQSRDLAAGAESDSPAMLRLSRERRAECRLQAQLARQLNQRIKSSNLSNTSAPAITKTSNPSNKTEINVTKISKLSNISALDSLEAAFPGLDNLLATFSKTAMAKARGKAESNDFAPSVQ